MAYITNRTLPFGKYKGREVHEIIDENLSYISWLKDNTSFQLNESEMGHYLQRLEEKKKKARRHYEMHPGAEAACDPWESWAWGGAVSPWGSDFM